jgi:predicted DNA-binding transcriptional regulator AlpA
MLRGGPEVIALRRPPVLRDPTRRRSLSAGVLVAAKPVDVIYQGDRVYRFSRTAVLASGAVSPKEALVGIAEIADMFGVARNTAWRWSRRARFPEPLARLASGPVWRREEIEAWGAEQLPLRTGRPPKSPS